MTGTKNILCMLPKYIIIHGFRSPLGQKMPWFWPKTIIFHFSKIYIFGCFKHGIMGRRFPDGGLLRYRKWVPQQLGDVNKQGSGDSQPIGARHGNTAANHTDLQSGCGRLCVFAVRVQSNLWDLIRLRTSHYSMGTLLSCCYCPRVPVPSSASALTAHQRCTRLLLQTFISINRWCIYEYMRIYAYMHKSISGEMPHI